MNKILLSSILLATPTFSFASNNSNDISPPILETIVVSSSRTEKVLMDAPLSMSVITQRDIENSPAEQVGELLRDIPGVTITDTSIAGAKRVRIRGEIGSNVLILIDGQEISEQRSFHGAAPLLIDRSNIERIEVVKGPSSVLYGSKAIGGVVNIITKKGGERALQAEFNTSFNSSTDGFSSNVNIYGSKNNFDYRLTASHAAHGDREVPNGTNDNIAYSNKDGVLENSAFDNSSINGYLAYNMDNFTIGGRYESYKADTESHTDNSIIEDGLDVFQLDLPKRDRKKASVFIEATDITENLVRARLDYFYQTRNRDFIQDLLVNNQNFAGPGSNMSIDLDLKTVFEQKNKGLQGQFDWVLGPDHYVVTGFDMTRDTMKSNVQTSTRTIGEILPFPGIIFDVTDITDTTVESHQDTKAIYIQDEWSLYENMTLTGGVRQTWVDTELDKENSSVLTKFDTNDARATGSLALVYSGIENMSIRAGWSQGFRAPSILELLEGTPHGGSGVLHANPGLDPETSNSYEVGLRFGNKQFVLDGALFYTRAKDYIATIDCSSSEASCPVGFGARDTQYLNVNGADTYGAEIFSSYEFTAKSMSIYSNLAYIKRKFKFAEFSTNETGLPSISGRLGLKATRSVGNIGYWADMYIRAAIDADNESPDTSSVTGKDKDHYAGWGTLNLSLGTEIGTKNPIKFSVHLNNILDKAYTPAQESLFSAGRHFVVNIGVTF